MERGKRVHRSRAIPYDTVPAAAIGGFEGLFDFIRTRAEIHVMYIESRIHANVP